MQRKFKLRKQGSVGLYFSGLVVGMLLLTFLKGVGISVPVIPNESIIEGFVSEYTILSSRLIGIQPEQVLYRVTVRIDSTEDLENRPNFIKGKEGRDVQFYTKEMVSPEVFGKRIKAKVEYRGDERSGMFWIREILVKER